VINGEIAQINGRQRKIRWVWGAISALSTAVSSLYTIAEGDDANAKITAGFALGAGLSALPAFLSDTDQERVSELKGKLAAMESARNSVLDTYREGLTAAADWNPECAELQAKDIQRYQLEARLQCQVEEVTYIGNAKSTEEQRNSLNDALGRFNRAAAELSSTLARFDQICQL
jgi:hypothetical protein